jgi:hypothetical protein
VQPQFSEKYRAENPKDRLEMSEFSHQWKCMLLIGTIISELWES